MWRGEPGFAEAFQDVVWNKMKPDRHPAVIVRARSTDDVARAVRLARDRGLQVKARSGGHSWTASSVRQDSMLIDLGEINDITVDVSSGTAVVGSGAHGDQMQEVLAAHGLFFPTGHCPTVGIGGFLLQGGWGWKLACPRTRVPECSSRRRCNGGRRNLALKRHRKSGVCLGCTRSGLRVLWNRDSLLRVLPSAAATDP